MSRNLKQICRLLLSGHYIAERQGNRCRFAVYKQSASPLLNVTDANYRTLSALIKGDRKGRMTFNLTSVRGLHGNHWLKQEYLKSKMKVQSA